MKKITPILVLILVIAIISISGCTDSNTTKEKNKVKTFDNDTISFDYPANMVVTISKEEPNNGISINNDTEASGCFIYFEKFPTGEYKNITDFESYVLYLNSSPDTEKIIEKNKITISGRNAYNLVGIFNTTVTVIGDTGGLSDLPEFQEISKNNRETTYKMSGKDEETIFSTVIDMKSGVLVISPNIEDVSDQKDSQSYKAYKIIINSLQIK